MLAHPGRLHGFHLAAPRVARASDELDWDSGFANPRLGFNGGGGNGDIGHAVALQADGKIIVAGSVEGASPGNWDMGVLRLNADGTIDTSFGFLGWMVMAPNRGGDLHDEAFAVATHRNGIVVAGTAQTGSPVGYDMAVCRLSDSGLPDTNFGTGGGCAVIPFDLGGNNEDIAQAIAVQSDYSILVAGRVEHEKLSGG